uniref:NAD(P)(+)--arginine ADP-ribosyltransferase n=1 Tax=Mola mola TaxID=94237 RepID=A0A3Q3XC67_MOLML
MRVIPIHCCMLLPCLCFHPAKQDIPLGFVKDAVDDMYFGCNETMVNVIDKYFERENTGMFAVIWKKARNCAQRNLDYKDKDKDLTMDHMLAICAYTSSFEKLYEQFNDAVRTKRSSYVTSFPFHSLHFWLTSAVQILSRNTKCLTTYRRSNLIFTGHVNNIIRYGFFASSSRKPSLLHFGEKTCFKIKTCSGAYLKKYPQIKDYEEEVLIPPYEIFKITEKIQNIPTNENNYSWSHASKGAPTTRGQYEDPGGPPTPLEMGKDWTHKALRAQNPPKLPSCQEFSNIAQMST